MSYNHVVLEGNLTRDPQMRYLANQTAVVDFGIAVNEKYRTSGGEQREHVLFLDCTAWAKLAELINQYTRKGNRVLIAGKLRFNTWEDKNGGGKRSKHSMHVDTLDMLGAPNDSNGSDQRQQPSRPPQRPQQQMSGARPNDYQSDGEPEFKEDDIPF